MATDASKEAFSTSQADHSTSISGTNTSDAENLTPLEQEVLDEYARLLGNLNNMSALLQELSANPSAEVLDALRGLERKTSLVFTLLKASVYSIVLNTQIREEEPGEGAGGLGDRRASGV